MPKRYTARQLDWDGKPTGESFTFYWDQPKPPGQEDVRRIFEDRLATKARYETSKKEAESAAARAELISKVVEITKPLRMFAPVVPSPETGEPTLRGGYFDIGPEFGRIYHGAREFVAPARPGETPLVMTERVARGGREAVGGAFNLAMRALPLALAAAPVETAIGLGATTLAHPAVERGLGLVGIPPETAGLAADILSVGAGAGAARAARPGAPPVEVVEAPTPVVHLLERAPIITPPPARPGPIIPRERALVKFEPPEAPPTRAPLLLPKPPIITPPPTKPAGPTIPRERVPVKWVPPIGVPPTVEKPVAPPPTVKAPIIKPPPPAPPTAEEIAAGALKAAKREPAVASMAEMGRLKGVPVRSTVEQPPGTDIAARALEAAGLVKPELAAPRVPVPPKVAPSRPPTEVPWRALQRLEEQRKATPPAPTELPEVAVDLRPTGTPDVFEVFVGDNPIGQLRKTASGKWREAVSGMGPQYGTVKEAIADLPWGPKGAKITVTERAQLGVVPGEDIPVGSTYRFGEGIYRVLEVTPERVKYEFTGPVGTRRAEMLRKDFEPITTRGEEISPEVDPRKALRAGLGVPVVSPTPAVGPAVVKPAIAKPMGERINELTKKEARTPEEEAELSALWKAAVAKAGGMPARKKGQKGAVDPEALNRLIAALKAAVPRRVETEKLYTAARGERLAKISSVKTPGVAGYYERLGLLKGELPKAASVKAENISQADANSWTNAIFSHPGLNEWDKLHATSGLLKVLTGEAVPQKGELILLGKVFGLDFVTLFKKISETPGWAERAAGFGLDLLGASRTMMATADLSWPFRQGLFTTSRKEFWNAFPDMFKSTFSGKAYDAVMDRIMSHPDFELAKKSGLDITEVFGELLRAREEPFQSGLPERIPVAGAVVRGSARAFTGMANKVRADLFYHLIAEARKRGENVEVVAPALAKYINAATGRGSLPNVIKSAAPILNAAFFSPKLFFSRITLLNPYTYINPKTPAFVRKQTLRDLIGTSSILLTILSLAKLGGAEVGMDPRSADFGKIKIGKTRIDIGGGFQQYLRLGAQLITGEYVSSTTGKLTKVGVGYKPLTRLDLISRFVESKEAPIASLVTTLWRGTTPGGGKLDVPKEVLNRYVPMVISDAVDIAAEDPELLPLVGLGTFGVGLQTYKPERGQALRGRLPGKRVRPPSGSRLTRR